MSNWFKNHPNAEIRALAEEVKGLLQGNAPTQQKIQAVAEIITPILTERLVVDDIWAQVIEEEDWTGTLPSERKFRVPSEFVGATRILTYQNGMTFPQFTANRRQVSVTSEEIATPEFVIDIRELGRQDPIITIADAEEAIRRMFLIHKAKVGYELLTHNFDTISGGSQNVTVIADDGTYDSQNQLAFLRTLRDTIEETCQNLVAKIGGNPNLKLVTESLTLARLKRSGLSAQWDGRVGGDITDNVVPGKVAYRPITEFPLQPYAFQSATDDINGFTDRGRPIITPGDILLIGPKIASIAQTEPLEPSVLTPTHWQAAYAYRAGYAYVRWSDKGDTNRMSRIMVVRKVGVQGQAAGTLVLDSLNADGAVFYSTRPIDKSTISNTTVKISASSGGAVATGALTAVMKGNLREFRVTFGSALTPGTTYYVTSTTGLKDVVGDAVSAMAEVVVPCA